MVQVSFVLAANGDVSGFALLVSVYLCIGFSLRFHGICNSMVIVLHFESIICVFICVDASSHYARRFAQTEESSDRTAQKATKIGWLRVGNGLLSHWRSLDWQQRASQLRMPQWSKQTRGSNGGHVP